MKFENNRAFAERMDAEDALAGQAWFFGWIAVALFVTAAVFSLTQWGLRPRSA